MTTKEARMRAVEWVNAHADNFSGFTGAYFGGSINTTLENTLWPDSSDIDITILADVPRGLSHVHYEGLLLEVSTHPLDTFNLSGEAIVSDF